MIFVSRVLRIGTSTITGIHYSKEALQSMVDVWVARNHTANNELFGTVGSMPDDGYIDLTHVATRVVNMYVDDEGLVVEQEVLDTPMGKCLTELLDNETPLQVIPSVYGTIKDNVIQSPAAIRYIKFKSIP